MNPESAKSMRDSGGGRGDARVAQEAAEWVLRQDRGLDETERREFAAWRRAHPQHEAELVRLGRAWTGLDAIDQVPELNALADTVLMRAQARRSRGRRTAWWAATSLAAAAALAVIFLQPRREPRGPFAGALSQNVQVIESTLQRQILPDGSAAELNGASRIDIAYTSQERRVRLVEGEAHFVVLPDPARPFYVTAGPVTVRAVGTAFNVRFDPEQVEVLVTHGKVKLERADPLPAESAAAVVVPAMVQGQRAVVSRGKLAAGLVEVADMAKPEIEEALGWQSTRLVFNNTPLDEVVEGFNHYNRHKLKLGDGRLRARQLTGVFRADNLDGFVRLLRSSIDVKAEQRTPTETVLLPMP